MFEEESVSESGIITSRGLCEIYLVDFYIMELLGGNHKIDRWKEKVFSEHDDRLIELVSEGVLRFDHVIIKQISSFSSFHWITHDVSSL